MSERTGLELAVIGLAGRFPQAPDAETLWRHLRDGADLVTRFDEAELRAAGVPDRLLRDPRYVRAGGVLAQAEDFDAAFFGTSAREAEVTDPQQRVFLECAWEALEDAGYDPQGVRVPAGVYAGVSRSTYLQHLLSHPELVEAVGGFQVSLGNDKDFLAPRVSYKLGLRGPSVVVQTACSTSLVAVHLACQALLAGECGLALAGGVSILFPQISGYVFSEGGIFSPDGVCRPFDARARGTLAGRGAGVVVLKRLEDALRDGDRVRAVIKGSAVNNDGGLKVGFTAPGFDGQLAVLRAALAAAEVEPESIGYVEAHGTGTELGDPLEVAALNRAFGPAGGVRSCALGALKGNIGHLDAAAGVAGLIKAVLALEHGQIPPEPHFERANPQIDFAAGPFYVNAELRAWPARAGAPRRAGVSSFGMGGTNAHVVLEEAPPREPLTPGRAWHVLVLSARTAAALEQVTERLATHLAAHPDLPLADVAFTAQTGRSAFARRRALVCRSPAEARQALATRAPELLEAHVQEDARGVFFLFPGQGTSHARLAGALYGGEPGFRAAFDVCADALRPRLALDLRRLVDPARSAADAEALWRETGLAQPALFAVEYALARLWEEWGLRPQALLGHGSGEYVAACLAGVLSLDDALLLVAERARLMQALPPGALLAVGLSEEALRPRLSPDLSLAAVDAPEACVVRGPREAVDALQVELAAAGISASRPHALHAATLEPLRGPFGAALRRVTLRAPQARYVSSATGTWITPAQALDPEHWLRQTLAPVRFADGLATLFAEGDGVLLEVGPGDTLVQLARQHPARPDALAAVACLPGPTDDDGATLAGAVARLWLHGVVLDWTGYHRHAPRRRVALPTYPFERRRYFVEARRSAEKAWPSPASSEVAHAAPPSPAAAPGTLHPRPELALAYVAPRDAREERLARLFGELLGVEGVGVHDNFFELGGHSLLATQLAEAVRASEGLELALRELFDAPTVARLAEDLAAREAARGETPREPVGLPQVVPDAARRHEPFPLTDVQQAYWIGRSGALELGQVATHTYLEADADDLDLPRFERAWQLLIARHDMLRAVFLPDGLQQVLPEVPLFRVHVEDLSALAPEARETALLERRRALSHRVLPAERWPLFDVQATRLELRRVRLHVSFDLLIGDAWSFGLMLSELARFYRQPELRAEPLALTFRDYVLAEEALQRTPLYARALDYWRARLRDLPPAPDLPLQRSLASLAAPRFTRRASTLSVQAWDTLRARAIRAGLTPSGVLLAAFCEVLAVWSRAPRFTLNLTLFNRLPLHEQVGAIVGDFTSLTLLAVDGARPGSFEERARRVQGQLFDDLDQRYVSAVRVLRELQREQGTRVLMPVVFTSTLALDARRGAAPEESSFAFGRPVFSISQTPQVLIDHQVGQQNGRLVFNWDAVDEAFPPGLLDDMFAAYCGLLARLADDESTWQATHLALVPPAQLAQRAAVNATTAPLPAGLLHEPFARRVREQPDELALLAGAARLSYLALARRAAALAARLRQAGVPPGALVAVELAKGADQIVAVLGVLGAGAAYLPVDPELPRARRFQLFERGRVAWVVRAAAAAGALPDGVQAVVVEEAQADLDAAPEASQRPHDLAYVIFTSGSTGQPKGVMIEHAAALNTVLDVNARFGVTSRDRVLGLSALNFDLSVWDVFGALAAGAALVLPDADKLRDPAHWTELLRRAEVSVWNSVPALMQLQVEHLEACGERLPDSLRLVLLSGDWLPVGLPDRIRALGRAVQVVSLGGATEASIWSIAYPIGAVDPAWPSIPYGRPLTNQTFHVLDARLEPRPTWVPGQLYVGGVGVARGYLHDEERSALSFIRHPRSGERLYHTGDLGRCLPNGELEFLGREDFQVKVQGYRIELGEIEAVLAQHAAVRAAVVSAVGERQGAKRLLAWIVWSDAGPVAPEELARFLRERLPEYMVPAAFLPLSALPLSANGKVDRTALPMPDGPAPANATYVAPRDQLELGLCRLFEDLLGHTDVGVQASFFELGGDSLQAVRLMTRIARRFGRRLPLGALFEAPRIADLATRLRDTGPLDADAGPLVALQPRGTRAPLFFVHPVGGNVFCYAALARELGARQPFHAFQSPGLAALEALPERLEELAASYVRELLGAQPAGPYFLGGWSFGGVVAFEMARQLSAAGRAVAQVTIIDAWAPAAERGLPEDDEASSLAAFALDLGIPPESHTLAPRALLARNPAERLAYLIELAQAQGALPRGEDHAQVQRLFEVFTHHNRQLAAYRGGPYAGRVTLLRAAAAPGSELQAEPEAGDARLGWGGHVTGALDVHVLPGNHYTLLAPAHVAALARRLEASLDRREADEATHAWDPSPAGAEADRASLDAAAQAVRAAAVTREGA